MSGFCVLCSHRVESFDGLGACPNCETKSIPCDDEAQASVSVNIQELRVLVQWAWNYAHGIREESPSSTDVVEAIAGRLRGQLPEGTCLTFADEMRSVREAFPGAETNHPGADTPDLGDAYRPNLGSEGGAP